MPPHRRSAIVSWTWPAIQVGAIPTLQRPAWPGFAISIMISSGSGGVPVCNEQTDGCMINHPDTDLANPEWNQSGVPWHTLYYKSNYPRLQNVKTKWDPLNIFYHALSIQAVG